MFDTLDVSMLASWSGMDLLVLNISRIEVYTTPLSTYVNPVLVRVLIPPILPGGKYSYNLTNQYNRIKLFQSV